MRRFVGCAGRTGGCAKNAKFWQKPRPGSRGRPDPGGLPVHEHEPGSFSRRHDRPRARCLHERVIRVASTSTVNSCAGRCGADGPRAGDSCREPGHVRRARRGVPHPQRQARRGRGRGRGGIARRGDDLHQDGRSRHRHQAGRPRRPRARGGLYVIGTNRHESLRVDQQLRGRSGRQGDPGSSRFFVSVEDPIIARYGIRRLMTVPGLSTSDEPTTNPVLRREISSSATTCLGQERNHQELPQNEADADPP